MDLPTINTVRAYTPSPLAPYSGDGAIVKVPLTKPPPLSEQTPRQRMERHRVLREQEHIGIPGGIDDALTWYYAYLKLADARNPDKAVSLTKESKDDYYRDLVYDLYCASGYSIDDSLKTAYSPQGDDLMRYLSDDKRHPLNRKREDDVAEE